MVISLEGILCYALFNLCLFYQKLFIQQAQIRLFQYKKVRLALLIYGILATVFGLMFILYWGWKVSWTEAAILYIFAFVITKFWGLVEHKIGLSRFAFAHAFISVFALIAFALLLLTFIP